MKKTIYLLTTILVTVGTVSCNKIKPQKVEKNITDGLWKITLYSDDGQNETHDFASYEFDFNENGSVKASNSQLTINGTWSVYNDDSNDDSANESGVEFLLSFPSQNNFDELSDDWDIISQSSTTLELEDVSGGDGSLDQLKFEKI